MKFYLAGIKGSGMAALALYLLEMGHEIFGADITEKLFTQTELERRKITIDSWENADPVRRGAEILIYSTAHADSSLVRQISSYLPAYEYHEFLALLLRHKKVIAVSGTHGKTTLVNMLDLVLGQSTDLIEGDGVGRQTSSPFALVEACEYKDHFLAYEPEMAVVLPLTLDHTDYFQDFESYLESFRRFAARSRRVYIAADASRYNFKGEIFGKGKNRVETEFDSEHGCRVKFKIRGRQYPAVRLPFYAQHQPQLALAALIIGADLGIEPTEGIKRLRKYRGPKRRMNVEFFGSDIIIDDYAHQPEQIESVLLTARRLAAGREVVLFFKPDRLKRLDDFSSEFARMFGSFDRTYLIPYHEITAARLQSFRSDGQIELYDRRPIFRPDPTVFCFLSSKTVAKEIAELKRQRRRLKTLP